MSRDRAAASRRELPGSAATRGRLVLGCVMVLAGAVVLGDVALASSLSPAVIGATAILVGASEIIHAVWSRRLGGALSWQILLGGL